MKNSFILIIAILIAACSSNKILTSQDEVKDSENDSISYELIVLDPGFDTWFITNSKASWYRSQAYYENWNQRYVDAWNHRQMGYRYAQLLDGMIDYDYHTDYGLEINHKLFYYFQYVENVLKIPIIDGGPRAAVY